MAVNTPSKIRFAPNGRMLVAPVSTAAPRSVAEEFAADWHELGYVSNEGVEITPSIETQGTEVWQSATPAVYTVQSASLEVRATLMQIDPDTTALYFGAVWVPATNEAGEPITGEFRLDLSSSPELAERSLAVEWEHAGSKSRLIIPRGMVNERDGLRLNRTDAQQLAITFSALDSAKQLGYVITNQDMEPAA